MRVDKLKLGEQAALLGRDCEHGAVVAQHVGDADRLAERRVQQAVAVVRRLVRRWEEVQQVLNLLAQPFAQHRPHLGRVDGAHPSPL